LAAIIEKKKNAKKRRTFQISMNEGSMVSNIKLDREMKKVKKFDAGSSSVEGVKKTLKTRKEGRGRYTSGGEKIQWIATNWERTPG